MMMADTYNIHTLEGGAAGEYKGGEGGERRVAFVVSGIDVATEDNNCFCFPFLRSEPYHCIGDTLCADMLSRLHPTGLLWFVRIYSHVYMYLLVPLWGVVKYYFNYLSGAKVTIRGLFFISPACVLHVDTKSDRSSPSSSRHVCSLQLICIRTSAYHVGVFCKSTVHISKGSHHR
ncbi:unnamed protein product [Sphacelaria rigidula]